MHVLLYCGKYDACMSYLKHYFLFGKAFLLHVSENSAKIYVLLDFSCNLSSCIWNIYTSFILKCQRIVRITPAYAGKSASRLSIWSAPQDHPRLRGEKSLATRSFIGITPAYAGKSDTPLCIICQSKDHPRLRGEKVTPAARTFSASGSPPPTRGKGVCGGA